LYLNSTSLGLNNTYLGQVVLTPLPLGQWNTLTFTPSSSVLTKLRGTYTDLQVTIVVNAPYNATQPYLLDNLRFSDSTLALVTVVDGGGHPLSGLTVTAYNGSTVTSNTGVTDSTGLAKVWVPPGSYRFGVTEAGVTTYSSATNQCQVPGICVAATITAKCHGVVCTAKDQCHSAGICDPSAGLCSNPNKADGTACSDGNACTKNDVCTAGACGGTAYTCSDGLACTADSCNGDGTCTFSVTAGNCLVGGACYAGGAGSPTNQCQQCMPATSQTAWSAKTNGTACNDGNACTSNDQCTAGTCEGTAYTCNDGLACTADSCNGDGTCSFVLSPGDCLIGGICYAAGVASPVNQCQQCAPISSPTGWTPKTDGTACNDGNACTKSDVCTAGACGGTAYSCDDGLACTADSCNGDGTCTHMVTTGNCLVNGACYGAGATSPTNQCQQCLPGSNQTSWSPKSNGMACDDANACTQTDSCQGGTCAGGNPVQCTASDQCHSVGTCIAGTGVCTNPAKPDGTACDDGDFLTTNDMCQSGQCVGTVTHGGQQLSGQTLPAQTGAPLVGPVPGSTPINLSVTLQLQNPTSWQELQDLAQQVSDPYSQKYRQFLGVDAFAAQFGAQPIDYQNVQDWATSHGLTVTTFANNLVAVVSGTAQAIEQALYVHLDYYSRPDGTQFYGPDRQPSLDPPTGSTLPILYIGNLDNMFVPRHLVQMANKNSFLQLIGTWGNGDTKYPSSFKTTQTAQDNPEFFGDDYRNAYAYDSSLPGQTTLTGDGQCVGLVSVGDFSLAFMQKYWGFAGRADHMPQITAAYAAPHQDCYLPPIPACKNGTLCGQATCKENPNDPNSKDWCTFLSLDTTYEAVCGVDYPSLAAAGKSASDLIRCDFTCPSGAGCGPASLPVQIYGGNNGTPTGSGCAIDSEGSEMNLDIQMVLAMAPKANITTYVGSDTISPLAGMASANPPCFQLSASVNLYDPNNHVQNLVIDTLAAELAMQGQAFFKASGDWASAIFDRTSSPFVTLVGQTLLWTTASNGTYGFELPNPLSGAYILDGNTPDICDRTPALVPIPWYQLPPPGIPLLGAQASLRYRNVPDVSIVGSNIGVAIDGNDPGQTGGTSASSPLWAGFWALANEQSHNNGLGPIGTANPVLYAIGYTRGTTSNVYDESFTDILDDANDPDDGVDGLDSCTGTTCDNYACNDTNQAKFAAERGYDLATGWGSPKYGLIEQLASTTPVPVQNVVVGGFQWACVVRSNSTLSCWGDNSFGELGGSSPTNPQLTPNPASGLPSGIASITAGWAYACVILDNGSVWCWGDDYAGELGSGGSDVIGPTEISAFHGASAVARGDRHTCALMPPNGKVLCVGNNADGQLGNGTTTSSSTPVQPLTNAKAIAAGGNTTCAIVGDDSHLECWGAQLGQYPNEGDPSYPRPDHLVPTTVYADAAQTQALTGVTAVAIGPTEEDDFCVIMLPPDGSVRCYGENAHGGVGNGTMGNHGPKYPTQVIASCDPNDANKPLLGATQVVVGEGYSCALLSSGTVECWGLNFEGELGDGTTVSRACPAPVSGSLGVLGVTALSASGTVTCSVADRGVYCWGDGILGDGSPAHESDKPVAVKFF